MCSSDLRSPRWLMLPKRPNGKWPPGMSLPPVAHRTSADEIVFDLARNPTGDGVLAIFDRPLDAVMAVGAWLVSDRCCPNSSPQIVAALSKPNITIALRVTELWGRGALKSFMENADYHCRYQDCIRRTACWGDNAATN